MGTRFAITCHHPSEASVTKAADAAFLMGERINEVASDYIADSELLGISKHPVGRAVPVSPLLFELISQARALAEKTEGFFDPTLGPLTRLWRESRRRKSLPDSRTLSEARAATGWQNLILDTEKSTVTFTKPGMRLDLGGIAKGQAADAMLRILADHGIFMSCITAGGDIRLGAPPPGVDGWKVGVRVNRGEADEDLPPLANCAVSTSGDLHQFVEIGGTRYSHIIDPATGLGSTRNVTATVIAPTATLSDALATTCCIAPTQRSRAIAMSAGATKIHLGHQAIHPENSQ